MPNEALLQFRTGIQAPAGHLHCWPATGLGLPGWRRPDQRSGRRRPVLRSPGTMDASKLFSRRTRKPSKRGRRVWAASREMARRNFRPKSAGTLGRPALVSNCCVLRSKVYSREHAATCVDMLAQGAHLSAGDGTIEIGREQFPRLGTTASSRSLIQTCSNRTLWPCTSWRHLNPSTPSSNPSPQIGGVISSCFSGRASPSSSPTSRT